MSARQCSVEGCARARTAHGLCQPHHRRQQRYGNPRADIPIAAGAARQSLAVTEGHTSADVLKDTGVTYRQLNYWICTGLVTPSISDGEGSGNIRLFSDDDLITAEADAA